MSASLISAIATFLAVLLPILLPALFAYRRPKALDARPQSALREALRARIRAVWPVPALLLALWLGGCGTTTVYIPHGEPVRLRETVRAKVWVMGPDGTPLPGAMDIPEGWYALPMEE